MSLPLSKEMKQVLIIGNYGATNIGDEAILESTLQALRKKYPRIAIHVLSANPKDTLERYVRYDITSSVMLPFGARTLLKNTIPFFLSLRKLKQSDTVIFGGGGLLTDKSSLYAVRLWYAHYFLIYAILGLPYHIYAQTVGPLKTKEGKQRSKEILENASSISVRDDTSLEEIKNLLPEKKQVERVLDPVFHIQKPPSTSKKGQELHIAFSLRPWHKKEEQIATRVVKALQQIPSTPHVHLIPMQYIREQDMTILEKTKEMLIAAKIPVTLHTPKDYRDVLAILDQCSFAIGMRLHFLILAFLANLPSLALSYSSKTTALMEQIGMARYSIDINEGIEQEELERLIREIVEKKVEIIKSLQKRQETLFTTFPEIPLPL